MRGVCPVCGFSGSMEAFLADPEWRVVLDFFPSVPPQLQRRAISLLGLFRKGGHAIKPARVLKILRGLQEMVSSGSVKWEGCETRPAPIELWIEALDAMLDSGKRGFADRQGLNYLRHTAWEKAAGLAAKAERKSGRREDRPEAGYFAPDPAVQQRRGCWTCRAFRPPSGCAKGKKPDAGNMVFGCGGGWEEKTTSVGEVLGSLVPGIAAEAE